MKAYIIKITFQYIEPVICRRIVMPAGATFNRLHETIQHVTNFQSADEPYHSYAFEVDNYYITNNEFILAEYKGSTYVGRQVKSPIRMKIDTYLEKNGKILYEYDFGDSWMIDLELESIVEDYYFGYPTVLTGAGIAPPEDVGGPPGYEEFLQVYHDPTHPDYLQQYSWAESQRYLPFDIDEVNERLKYVKYQKTEWQHIEHDNYYVLSNKYRRSDVVDIELIPDRELVMKYVAACANLYGIIQHSQFLKIYNSQNERQLTSKELRAIFADPM
ncbi:MAG: plasmid pRiA4b ORF-3 family protein, partial [Lysinibacillus sp.]